MTLYTPYPLERVLEGIENLEPPQEITIGDITMQVEMLSHSQARIVRLISPRPDDYLNPAYSPGAIIQYSV